MRVDVREAEMHLSRLLVRVEEGERILIARAGRPIAALVPIDAPRPRRPGRDRIVVHDGFDAPLDESEPEFAHVDDPVRGIPPPGGGPSPASQS
jgi:prevent-host-death family protein